MTDNKTIGKSVAENGDYYEGEWLNEKKHGQGKYMFSDGEEWYDGEWENNQIHGNGIYKYADGNMYIGQFINGYEDGIGKMIFKDGNIFEGGWYKGKTSGYGKIIYSNGDIFEGSFTNNIKYGYGETIYSNGMIEKGYYEEIDGEIICSPFNHSDVFDEDDSITTITENSIDDEPINESENYSTCSGCYPYFQENQKGHMDKGGCMYISSEDDDNDEESSIFIHLSA